MILLDTNVLSELMRPAPEPAVLAWLDDMPISGIGTTTITLAEIKYGLARLDPGKRRRALEIKFAGFVLQGFERRIFAFDQAAAEAYGDLVVARDHIGRPLRGFDGLIAAIAHANGFAIATRNQDHFETCGLKVLNPWDGRRSD